MLMWELNYARNICKKNLTLSLSTSYKMSKFIDIIFNFIAFFSVILVKYDQESLDKLKIIFNHLSKLLNQLQ